MGKGCRHISLDERLRILGSLAEIFYRCKFRFIVQTVARYTLNDLRQRGIAVQNEVGVFRLSRL